MKTKKILRTVSTVMFIIAVIFLSYALTHPEFGTVFYIGSFSVGLTLWRLFYLIYAVVTVGLFTASLVIKE